MTGSATPIAVSLGDPAGIGPEIIVKSWVGMRDRGPAPFFVVDGAGLIETTALAQGITVPVVRVDDPAQVADAFVHGLPVLGDGDVECAPGAPSQSGASAALGSLVEATRLVLAGRASALVTAPVAKAQLATVGFEFPGQTEYLAAACGIPYAQAVMMLAGPSLRTVPLTVHCRLADVAGLLTTEMICDKAWIVASALARDFGIAEPRLAICGLNPHAGEGGKFGHEERDIIAPAIKRLNRAGIAVTGPHPADAIFTPRAREGYDAVLAMYHDQALIPIKTLHFDEGVNVTLGLPIVRTSPDHGTAFDIAGQGLADPGAMIAAIRMAAQIAARRATHD